jgi:uncharacterized protein YjbI with pentapeptide repeats
MPVSKRKPLCQLLSNGDVDAFNREVTRLGGTADLSDTDLRGLDLRRANLKHADLTGAYLRAADLRGVDLSEAHMAGASLRQAQISGTLFPQSLGADEIRMSAELGTRMRPRV